MPADATKAAAVDHRAETDQRIEIFLGHLLRLGVVVAALVVITGGVLYLKGAPSTIPNYKDFHGQPEALRSVPAIIQGSADFQPLAVIQFGLILLIATPVARVFFSIIGFAMERDWLYIVVTIIVLALLLHSLVGDVRILFNR